jgi:hypothetical protein
MRNLQCPVVLLPIGNIAVSPAQIPNLFKR